MQYNAHFLRNISLTLNQLHQQHYSFHTSHQTYFLQTQTYLMPNTQQLRAFSRTKVLHIARWPTNIPKTSGGNLRKSKFLGPFNQSCVLHIAELSNTLKYNWNCAYANEFPVAVKDVNGAKPKC